MTRTPHPSQTAPHAHDYDMTFEDHEHPLRATFRCACGDVASDAETAIQRMRESHHARLAWRPPYTPPLHPFPLFCALVFFALAILNAALAHSTGHWPLVAVAAVVACTLAAAGMIFLAKLFR